MPLLQLPRPFHVNSSGTPYASAKLYIYRAGTTTDLDVYTTSALNVAHSQPIQADTNGIFPAIYIDPGSGYDLKVVLKTSADVTIYTEDNIPRSESEFQSGTFSGLVYVTADIEATGRVTGSELFATSTSPRVELYETDAATDKKSWELIASGSVLTLRTMTDALASGKTILSATRGTTTALSAIAIGNATDVPTITLNGTTLVAANIVQQTSGSFTGTLTGVSGTVTGSVSYVIHNGVAYLYSASSIVGTSTSTALTMTGLPASLQPSGNRYCYCALSDNSAQIGGLAYLTNSGTITFTTAFAGSGTFTAANQKGLFGGWNISYPL